MCNTKVIPNIELSGEQRNIQPIWLPWQLGGYWLVGLGEPKPELFSRISWSTGTVLEQTLEHARAGGLRFRLLRELRDVDTLGDWYAFLRDNSFA